MSIHFVKQGIISMKLRIGNVQEMFAEFLQSYFDRSLILDSFDIVFNMAENELKSKNFFDDRL